MQRLYVPVLYMFPMDSLYIAGGTVHDHRKQGQEAHLAARLHASERFASR
jgi:hypothetical protein